LVWSEVSPHFLPICQGSLSFGNCLVGQIQSPSKIGFAVKTNDAKRVQNIYHSYSWTLWEGREGASHMERLEQKDE
jgi:hypothetical protein